MATDGAGGWDDLVVRPFEGAGPVRFGMTREQVRTALAGYDPCGSSETVEYFARNSLQVEFDANGGACFVEVSAGEGFDLVVDGLRLLEVDDAELVRRLGPPDEGDSEYPYSFHFPALGIALWRPAAPTVLEEEVAQSDEEDERAFLVEEIERAHRFATAAAAVRGYRD